MTLAPTQDPIDIPHGATIRRPDPSRPFVAMSNRKRWSQCALSAVLPQLKTPSGPEAEKGTAVHLVGEWALHRRFGGGGSVQPPVIEAPAGLKDFDYTDRGIEAWRAEALTNATTYADKAWSMVSDIKSPSVCMVECKIDNVTIHGVRVFTIADAVVWNASARRVIGGDYKNGRLPVGAGTADEPNPQVAGSIVLWCDQAEHLQPQQIGGFVYQPNTLYGDAWQCWGVTNPDQAAAWIARERTKLHTELAAVARAASELAAGRLVGPTPGDHCTYCPSARWCPAAAAYGQAALQVEAGTKAVVDWTPEEVMAIWASRAAFKTFEEDLKERVKMLQEANHPAVQVKRRTGNRIWDKPAAVVEALLMADRAALLQPPGVTAASAVLPAEQIETLTKRAPDVETFVATDGKQPERAAGAFAKYLQEKQ